jgi:hypothetical protein
VLGVNSVLRPSQWEMAYCVPFPQAGLCAFLKRTGDNELGKM